MPKITHADEFDEQQMFDDPLAKYYRMPGVHVRLPSEGAFMPPGSVQFTMNGDVPVYPMRAADELLLKSPDALMSGHAIEELLKSCVPAIKTPRLVTSADLDVLLLAIRTATYGEILELEPVCPKCETVNQSQVNMAVVLASTKPIPPEHAVRLSDDVVVFLRPYNMENVTQMGIISFEETRKVQALEEAEDNKRLEQMNKSMHRMVVANLDAMASCVIRIIVKEGEVTDHTSIRRFIDNVSKSWTDKLQAKLDELNGLGMDKTYDMKCAKCGHKWRPEIEFNATTFFVSAS
ncbi:MAG: hypothetical protein C5B44_06170 [Acidobacteria bacterium]|nr:MAG: hypothetical protein C5B44_06170 [Acidobacteriota bacterium]